MFLFQNILMKMIYEVGELFMWGQEDDNIYTDAKKIYKCRVCYKDFRSKSTLDCHMIGGRHKWRKMRRTKSLGAASSKQCKDKENCCSPSNISNNNVPKTFFGRIKNGRLSFRWKRENDIAEESNIDDSLYEGSHISKRYKNTETEISGKNIHLRKNMDEVESEKTTTSPSIDSKLISPSAITTRTSLNSNKNIEINHHSTLHNDQNDKLSHERTFFNKSCKISHHETSLCEESYSNRQEDFRKTYSHCRQKENKVRSKSSSLLFFTGENKLLSLSEDKIPLSKLVENFNGNQNYSIGESSSNIISEIVTPGEDMVQNGKVMVNERIYCEKAAGNEITQNSEITEIDKALGNICKKDESEIIGTGEERRQGERAFFCEKETASSVIQSGHSTIGSDTTPTKDNENDILKCKNGKNNSDEISDPFNVGVLHVSLNYQPEKRYKIKKNRTRREKLEHLKMMSIRRHGSEMEPNALFLSMLESYEYVLGYEVYNQATLDNECNFIFDSSSYKGKLNLSKSAKEAYMQRDLVLTELADSEKNYIEDLGFIVNKYTPLLKSGQVTQELMADNPKICLNIAELYEFHCSCFQEKIEDCLENPDLLDETFEKHEDRLTSLYTEYCSRKPMADEALDTHEGEMNEVLRSNFPDCKLNIKDFLIKPVQRLMKYQLLLTAIRKYSLRAGKYENYLNVAMEVMDRVPKEANNAMHVGLISGYMGIGRDFRELMRHDDLEVIIGKTKAKSRTMHVFLFQKTVIFTEKTAKLTPDYCCIAYGETSCMGLTEVVENEALKFAIWFRKYNKSDIYVCLAETIEKKTEWIKDLKDTLGIQVMLKRKESRGRQKSTDIRKTPTRKRLQTLVIGEAVIEAMKGHPRLGSMSDKLKRNIENYIIHEILLPCMDDEKQNTDTSNTLSNASVNVLNQGKPFCIPSTPAFFKKTLTLENESFSQFRISSSRGKSLKSILP